MESFGDRLKRLRILHSLTQEELADKLGVSAQAVSKWEKEKSFPDLSVVVPMANLFRISTDELLGNRHRREEWEERWQLALRDDGEEGALRVAEEAVLELPQDRQFRYRQACGEFFSSQSTAVEDEKQRLLVASERHFRSILLDWPDFDSAAGMLVEVLAALERRQEAETLAKTLPDHDRLLLRVLKGEALEEQRRKVVTTYGLHFVASLISLSSPDALRLAETILNEAPWDRDDRANLFTNLFWKRAALSCEAGNAEAAMASLFKIRELLLSLETAGDSAETEDTPPYLTRLMAERPASGHWKTALGFLEARELAPLREREDYQALLREVRTHF